MSSYKKGREKKQRGWPEDWYSILKVYTRENGQRGYTQSE